ncbi:MAG: glycoside hydrolase family 38 C-terminal domain-containing protein [Prochlorococcaceae cyanobacterium]
MSKGPQQELHRWIETFQSRSLLDLQPLWRCRYPDGSLRPALQHPWGAAHRPDWSARGLIIWPRGGQWWDLRWRLDCPAAWRRSPPPAASARLALRWWADAAELVVDGVPVRSGDLFDTACRWALPPSWWQGQSLELQLRLRSPLHDDGALMLSRIELEPPPADDPGGILLATELELALLRLAAPDSPEAAAAELAAALAPLNPSTADPRELRRLLLRHAAPAPGVVHLLGHAHLDLAWLWPVADTWQAAERTFASALELIERFEELHFGHSTPALYAWLEINRPSLFARIRRAMQHGRWEPLNGPWVESDCVLISTASLWHQFRQGQLYSRSRFPEWEHRLCWLPDSFGFAAGLPAVAQATGVRWFCTHKLAWNATNPFPHRLFRWRSRCGAELLALFTAPIGTDGDPLAIERHRLDWRRVSGVSEALWLPGVGDHGGGPTAEMLEQLRLWAEQPLAAPQRHGSVRAYLAALEPEAPGLPVWRDELYLELHRGCATSRPDQKRHNRSLERLLREAELAKVLAQVLAGPLPASALLPEADEHASGWPALLFQQFHDILPGTSIPEVFEQAEPAWRRARRQAAQARDGALRCWLAGRSPQSSCAAGTVQPWWVVQLQPHAAARPTVRLPAGLWSAAGLPLAQQPAAAGGVWLQLPPLAGITALPLERRLPAALAAGAAGPAAGALPLVEAPVLLECLDAATGRWRLANGLVSVELGPQGIEQLADATGRPLLAGPLELRRWRDQGEFWDAWDLAGDYRDQPLPLQWQGQGPPELLEQGPLCARFLMRGLCGCSALRLEGRLLAGTAWLELIISLDWRQRHELLRLELPLAGRGQRLAADTSGGVLERPAQARTPREASRWEVPVISWCALQADQAGLAVLLDGPQGVSASPERLGISLLRSPTWPDPGADNGWQRLRLALLPCSGGWRPAKVPQQALRFREPLWCRPQQGAQQELQQAWPPLAEGLQLLGLRPRGDGAAQGATLAVQNLTPCRRWLTLPGGWRLLARVDGLGQPLAQPQGQDPLAIRPWELAFWHLDRQIPASDSLPWAQSS